MALSTNTNTEVDVSLAKIEFIECCVTLHMGESAEGVLQQSMGGNPIENIDETHFVINMNNGRTLAWGATIYTYKCIPGVNILVFSQSYQ